MELKKTKQDDLQNSGNNDELINPEFVDLFELSSDAEADHHEARMMMYRFLSEIERLEGNERGLKKKISKAINRSQSYVTQLFNGNKLINLITLAKIQKSFKLKFKITALPEDEFHEPMLSHFSSVNFNMVQNHIYLDSEKIYFTPTELFLKTVRNDVHSWIPLSDNRTANVSFTQNSIHVYLNQMQFNG